LKAPRKARPIGVRAVETMTAWRMVEFLLPAVLLLDDSTIAGHPQGLRSDSSNLRIIG